MKAMYFAFHLIFLPFSLANSHTDSQKCNTTVSEGEVAKFVLARPELNSYSRPRRNFKETVEVTITMNLFGIKDFIERQCVLMLEGYVTATWIDEYLIWNYTFPQNCVERMMLAPDKIWQAELSVVAGVLGSDPSLIKSPEVHNRIWVESNGQVTIFPIGEFAVNCDLDLALFPFDVQLCSVVIESWDYPHEMQALRLSQRPFLKVESFWMENKHWELIGNSTRLNSERSVDNLYYDRVFFNMLIRRRSLFYHINIIIPGIVIAIVEVVAFLLPIETAIKVNVSFTCLLAYSVFQTMIIGDMPRSSESVPLLSLYIDLQMAYIGLIALLGEAAIFLIIRKADIAEIAPPKWIVHVFRAMAPVLCLQDLEKSVFPSIERSSSITLGNVVDHNHVAVMPQKLRGQWVYLAETIERANMWLYILAITITPAVMFTLMPPPKHL